MIQMQGVANSVAFAREQRYKKFVSAALQYQQKKDMFRLALCLQVINNEKLYLEGGYKNVHEFAKDILKVTKVSSSNYLSVAKNFLDTETGDSVFKTDKGDFNFTQFVELKKLPFETVKELVSNGTVTYDSSAKELKKLVSDLLAKDKKKKQDKLETELKPLNEAYENFHKAYNELKEIVKGNDKANELMQIMMDSTVLLYNENDRLWGAK